MAGVLVIASTAQAQCPGYNSSAGFATNLACEYATSVRATGSVSATTTNSLSATLATQLSQLPIAASATGTGITIGASGLPTVSTEGLGTILTQRGTTIGKHKLLFSFNFQRFGFNTVDGISLKTLPLVVNYNPGLNNIYLQDQSDISFRVDQYTAIATFGLFRNVDVSFILPFSNVQLSTPTSATLHSIAYSGGCSSTACSGSPTNVSSVLITPNPLALPGSATGIGDVRVNVKAKVVGGEGKNAMALGTEVRFPSGDAVNYLGTGAYGVKPYMVFSHRGRLTPNFSLAYQWNGSSVLNNFDNLPGSFLYSGGADLRVSKKVTFTGEFLGQYVINAPRLRLVNVIIPVLYTATGVPSVQAYKGSYFMNNGGGGFKFSPVRHLTFSASALIPLDDAGLRSSLVPLFGAAYQF